MDMETIFKKMPEAFNGDEAGDLSATVQYKVSDPKYCVIDSGTLTVHDGVTDDADVTLTLDDDDFVALMTGELNGMTAFMTGKLQLEGDLMLAQKLSSMFDAGQLS
ncbi:SCP2 sterol-binding domain-containing protein [uncultured Abyssibacter sp.]|uniref:SCP2 sterol-binding domain-containing protein n=1 Tax=uncultured Abyssibacter sp. TaxID=2320202 RepID=UPI0032B10B6A